MPCRAVLLFSSLAAVAILLAASGCAGAARRERSPVVIVSIDTLRADHLPAYGYRKVETPHLERFRRDAVLYENAYTHAPLTLPAHVSLLTGLLPFEHGVRDNLGYRLDAAKHRTLAAVLKAAGYATGAAVSAYALRGATGIGDGFDVFEDRIVASRSTSALGGVQRPGGETLALIEPWLDGEEEHGILLYRASLRVPLMLKLPHGERAGTIVGSAVALIDIVPTLAARLGFSPPKALRGLSLLEPSQTRPDRVYAETFYPRLHLGWSELRSLVDERWQYVEGRRRELYDMVADPMQHSDVLAANGEIGRTRQKELARFPAGLVGPQAEVRAFPANSQAWARLAIVYGLEKRTAREVDGLLDRMVAANPTAETMLLAAKTLESMGDSRGAKLRRERLRSSGSR